MARELNRELFGDKLRVEADAAAGGGGGGSVVPNEELRRILLYTESLAKKLKEVEARGETVAAKVDDVVRQNKQRFERVQGHFQNQDEVMKGGFADIHAKIAQVASRVNERKVSDSTVKDMVDRHAQLVQSFEVRLNQMQRLVSEQELQLLNARAELKEALQELARLKRM